MKPLQAIFALLLSLFVLTGTVHAQDNKGWSKKAKGAAVGGGAGAVTGAVVGGGKGAIVGGAVGAVAGGAIGRRKDKKKDPVRYEQYANKNRK